MTNRAKDETRTRDPHLGKVMLYQLSYFRIWEGKYMHISICAKKCDKKNLQLRLFFFLSVYPKLIG